MSATIYIHEKEHRGKLHWFLPYRYSDAVDKLICNLPGRHWSQTNRAWYIPTDRNTDALNKSYAEPARFILEKQKKKANSQNRFAVNDILHSDQKIRLKLSAGENIASDLRKTYYLQYHPKTFLFEKKPGTEFSVKELSLKARYTHIAKTTQNKIQRPLDSLHLSEEDKPNEKPPNK